MIFKTRSGNGGAAALLGISVVITGKVDTVGYYDITQLKLSAPRFSIFLMNKKEFNFVKFYLLFL
jgi:hypothetical protein